MANPEEMLADMEKQIGGLEEQVTELLAKLAKHEKDGDGEGKSVKRYRAKLDKAKSKSKDDSDDDSDDDGDSGDDYDDMDDDEDDTEKSDKSQSKTAKSDKADDKTRKAADSEGDKTKKAANDETIKVGDQLISKAAVGEAAFAIFKAQAAQLHKANEDIAKERDLRITAELKKRADDEFPHVPGSLDERVAMLKAMDGMDEAVRKSFTAVLTQAQKLAKAAFDTIGSNGGKGDADGAAFMTKVSEIKKRDNCSQSEALTKARKEFPEEFKAYQASN